MRFIKYKDNLIVNLENVTCIEKDEFAHSWFVFHFEKYSVKWFFNSKEECEEIYQKIINSFIILNTRHAFDTVYMDLEK